MTVIAASALRALHVHITPVWPCKAIKAVSAAGHRCQARNDPAWAGSRGTVGAKQGRVNYGIAVADEGVCRVGWCARQASLTWEQNLSALASEAQVCHLCW